MAAFKIGDWVTQYSAGFWMVMDIKPKYADSDYDFQDTHWKKGCLIGQWVILKKAFTPKMKRSIRCECVDAAWCRPVNPDVQAQIAGSFQADPAYTEKFRNAPAAPEPEVISVWMNIPEPEEDAFQMLLTGLPEKYTIQEFWNRAQGYRAYVSMPPASHLLTFRHHCWELDSRFDPVLFGAELEKLS